MCFLVVVGNFSCGHTNAGLAATGIHPTFNRPCMARRSQFHNCPDQIQVLSESIPWMCADCHWRRVSEIFVPVRTQNDNARAQFQREAQAFPAEGRYLGVQRGVDQMEQEFARVDAQIGLSVAGWHLCRDRALRAFLGEHFEAFMMSAPEDCRTWNQRLLSNPWVRDGRSGFVREMPADTVPSGLPPAHRPTPAGPAQNAARQEPAQDERFHSSSPPPYEPPAESGRIADTAPSSAPASTEAVPFPTDNKIEEIQDLVRDSPAARARCRWLLSLSVRNLAASLGVEVPADSVRDVAEPRDEDYPLEPPPSPAQMDGFALAAMYVALTEINDWTRLVGRNGTQISRELRQGERMLFIADVLSILPELDFPFDEAEVKLFLAYLVMSRHEMAQPGAEERAIRWLVSFTGGDLDRVEANRRAMPVPHPLNHLRLFRVLVQLQQSVGWIQRTHVRRVARESSPDPTPVDAEPVPTNAEPEAIEAAPAPTGATPALTEAAFEPNNELERLSPVVRARIWRLMVISYQNLALTIGSHTFPCLFQNEITPGAQAILLRSIVQRRRELAAFFRPGALQAVPSDDAGPGAEDLPAEPQSSEQMDLDAESAMFEAIRLEVSWKRLVGLTGAQISAELRREDDQPFVANMLGQVLPKCTFRFKQKDVINLLLHLVPARYELAQCQANRHFWHTQIPRSRVDLVHLMATLQVFPGAHTIFSQRVFRMLCKFQESIEVLELIHSIRQTRIGQA